LTSRKILLPRRSARPARVDQLHALALLRVDHVRVLDSAVRLERGRAGREHPKRRKRGDEADDPPAGQGSARYLNGAAEGNGWHVPI
jgi:hypothetical protein